MKYLRYDAFHGVIPYKELFEDTKRFVLNSMEELEKDIKDNYWGHDDYPARLRYDASNDTITEICYDGHDCIHYRNGDWWVSERNNSKIYGKTRY